MASPTATRLRRAPVTARPAPARRPPLRVVRPATTRRRPSTRRWAVLSTGFLVGSMLLAGLSQAYLTQGQVRLARLQQQLVTAQAHNHDLQLQVAQLEDPARVIATAQSQGLSAPSQVTALPLVGATGTGAGGGGR